MGRIEAMNNSPFTALVWEDDFSGMTLDYSKWECEVNAFGGGNNKLQLYTDRPENVRVENGCRVLEAHRGRVAISGTERDFTSGRVRSKQRGDWNFGRFEICAKIPFGRGLWPAIWMLPTDDAYGSWAASGEIDIMEAFGRDPGEIRATLHFGGSWPENASNGPVLHRLPDGQRFCNDFHVYVLEWTSVGMRWFVDDQCFRESPASEWWSSAAPSPAPFDQRFHLIFNIAVGGNPVDPPDHTTPFPARMEIDWVRVYQ
jgi:beta-glucanase (GH16 family)